MLVAHVLSRIAFYGILQLGLHWSHCKVKEKASTISCFAIYHCLSCTSKSHTIKCVILYTVRCTDYPIERKCILHFEFRSGICRKSRTRTVQIIACINGACKRAACSCKNQQTRTATFADLVACWGLTDICCNCYSKYKLT